MTESDPAHRPTAADAQQVMQGDIVRSNSRVDRQLGWVCCVTPESDEGHVYWQPHGGAPAVDSREPLRVLQCVDRALIPGDIVRRCDVTAGEGRDTGGRDRDAMGMVVGTEVMLDLVIVEDEDRPVRQGISASSLRHLVPIRLVTWVVHRADGWLGRVQSWDEDLVICFSGNSESSGVCRCRVRAANLKQGIAIAESFYRDFFPGLSVSVSVQDLQSGALECEWLAGDVAQLVARAAVDADAEPGSSAPQRMEAVIEEVRVGVVRVEWVAQVPLRRGWSTERPPRSDGCQEDKLLFLLGEAECSSRWALGDRLRFDSMLAEVCSVETFVDVRWQDDALSVRVPARELQLCNPDAFSFFPSELVCQRMLEESSSGAATPFRCSPPPPTPPGNTSRHDAGSRGGSESISGERSRRDEQQPRVGFVVRADPASRMVSVRWLDEGGPSKEEEWSAFDLQIDPEFGYRLGDAVIRCRDWEEPVPRDAAPADGSSVARVGQVAALEAGSVRVRWLDSAVSLHNPRELYRVGDEDEGSMAESQDATVEPVADGEGNTTSGPAEQPESSRAPTADLLNDKDAAEVAEDESTEEGATAGGQATEEDASTGRSGASEGTTPEVAPPALAPANGSSTTDGAVANNPPAPLATAEPAAVAMAATEVTDPGELSFEDMAWEPLPSDHHFVHCAPHPPGPSGRQFMRRVQREWAILQRGLPRGVWVHVYPDRMELLRACLVGPEGTPYFDALFFFDVHLPPNYPQIPPQVRFWSFGENLNPNLYENGKVCLSLLGTWSGKDSETWSPERSNLLQVLVSILGLVLNTEPYYNEPGFERERDTPQGGLRSQRYNESVALSNYHLMLRVLRTPPCDFDRAVKRHFAERRPAILDRARHLHAGDNSLCSEGFKKSLAALLPRLEEALPEEMPP